MNESFQATAAWLQTLRDHHISFFERWVQSADGKAAWLRIAEELREELLATPLERLIDRETLAEVIRNSFAATTIDKTLVPALRHALTTVTGELCAREEPVAVFVSEEARASIDDLLAEPKLLSEPLVRAALQNPAAEVVMHEILYDALRQFSDKVNPFFADWGIPALLDRLPTLARGPAKRAFAGMRDEFDRRLEPEIKRFLKSSCRHALTRTADLIIKHDAHPDFISLRRQLAAQIREQGIAELVYPPLEPRGMLAINSACEIVRTVLSSELLHDRLLTLIHEQVETHGGKPLGELLAELGVALPPAAPLAQASWPAVLTALNSTAAHTQIASFLDASHAAFLDGD